VGGGLASQQSHQPLNCVGEGCQGQPSGSPPRMDLGSSTFNGKGNLKPRRCRHHHRRKHRHHKARSHQRKASKAPCKPRHRRAG